jgi:hypothetical protein
MLTSVQIPIVKLKGRITTTSFGIEKLLQFYHEARQHTDCEIFVDCYELKWIDANLAAILHAIDHSLMIKNKVRIRADFEDLKLRFDVLFRNGWLQDRSALIWDHQQTTLPCTQFTIDQEDDFLNYINKKLLCHRGMPVLEEKVRRRIQADLIEIYTNIYRHAKTNDPFFVCGQYYPSLNFFKFTMVDLGVGFLQPIREYTNGQITTEQQAITWALKGNSVTGEQLAGMGLQGIYTYCRDHNGQLQIMTGHGFWNSNAGTIEYGHKQLLRGFQGSIINLFFPFKP